MYHGYIQHVFFVYKVKQQIVALIVETLNRISAAVSYKLSAKGHWEEVDAFMSDSVTKTWDLVTFHIIIFTNHIPVNDLI